MDLWGSYQNEVLQGCDELCGKYGAPFGKKLFVL